MLRTNLSTRPFYNERAVHLALVAAAALVAAITVYNATRVVALSGRHAELTATARGAEADAHDLEQQAVRIRRDINNEELETVVDAAREANAIIDRRTFSWTELFNRIETTLPAGVMILSIRPHIDTGVISITMVVVGRRVEDIDTFMEKLEAEGGFEDLLSRQEEMTPEATYKAVLVGRYQPAARRPAPAPPPASTRGRTE